MGLSVKQESEATNRALLVLVQENRRQRESAERVRLVLEAVALRRGVISCSERPRQVTNDFDDIC